MNCLIHCRFIRKYRLPQNLTFELINEIRPFAENIDNIANGILTRDASIDDKSSKPQAKKPKLYDEKLKFARLLEQHPIIWDQSNPGYSNNIPD